MVDLKAIQKITPMDVSVSGTIDKKHIWKKLGGASAPLAPPGSVYGIVLTLSTLQMGIKLVIVVA